MFNELDLETIVEALKAREEYCNATAANALHHKIPGNDFWLREADKARGALWKAREARAA